MLAAFLALAPPPLTPQRSGYALMKAPARGFRLSDWYGEDWDPKKPLGDDQLAPTVALLPSAATCTSAIARRTICPGTSTQRVFDFAEPMARTFSPPFVDVRRIALTSAMVAGACATGGRATVPLWL